MIYALRNLLSMALLPGTAAGLIPWWLVRRAGGVQMPEGPAAWAAVAAGALSLAVGLALFSWSLAHFWTRGRGTLAPWDPPRVFVASGPYRVVRHPMISGVIFVLAGEALLLRSPAVAVWAGIFVAINATYLPLVEEPGLLRRFGGSYANYQRRVPRFLPRPIGAKRTEDEA
ncbi:MAG: isoprenylcysteine carboxylmethyltransferase family protein [Bauldia sp.]